jgi:hypothetical protein
LQESIARAAQNRQAQSKDQLQEQLGHAASHAATGATAAPAFECITGSGAAAARLPAGAAAADIAGTASDSQRYFSRSTGKHTALKAWPGCAVYSL